MEIHGVRPLLLAKTDFKKQLNGPPFFGGDAGALTNKLPQDVAAALGFEHQCY